MGQVLDAYLDASLHFVAEHRGFFVVITQTHLDFDWHGVTDDERSVRSAFDHDLHAFFSAAIERGELPPADPNTYLCAFQGGLNSFVARWVRSGDTSEKLFEGASELRAALRRALCLPDA